MNVYKVETRKRKTPIKFRTTFIEFHLILIFRQIKAKFIFHIILKYVNLASIGFEIGRLK